MTEIKSFGEKVIENLEKVIVGKRPSLELIVIGLLCHGHVLIEDVPGVGKTVMARSLARSLDCSFNRIQFTPDMLPSDVTGVSIFNQQKREFEFRPGPIMGQIILADEINRATPKTQAALLEAMEERQVTVDGVTHALPRPFMVLATQNPIEYEGTFPLPEAQLDRFLLRVRIGISQSPERNPHSRRAAAPAPAGSARAGGGNQSHSVCNRGCQKGLRFPAIKRYIVELDRPHPPERRCLPGRQPARQPGVIPYRAGRAALLGRDHVLPDDIQEMAVPVLGHRIIVGPAARLREVSADRIVREIVENLAVPGGDYRSEEIKGEKVK
jgi:MoxR-like ATPase